MSKSGLYFYSEKCKNCQKLMPSIELYKNELQFCCIDYPNVRRTIPTAVTSVPSLVLAGENKPLVGNAIYEWIRVQESKTKKSSANSSSNIGSPGEPAGTCFEWSGGSYSDIYSFIEDSGRPQEHAFSFLDNGNSSTANVVGNGIQNPPNRAMVQEPKRNDNEVTSRMERFIAQRDKEVTMTHGPPFIP
tara:strand:- start:5284 stop:5850 length:567 start_codon:yes stop_codon:yes gene_type:complete